MTFPDFSYEKRAYKKGFRVIAGLDEVGRGSFAGPVVAGAVAFAPNSKFETLNSKQMLRIINLKTKLYKDISLDNFSWNEFSKIISFYATLENYNYKIIR